MQSLILAAEGGYQAFEFTSTEWAWLIFTGWSTFVFVAGFRLFAATRPLFASLV